MKELIREKVGKLEQENEIKKRKFKLNIEELGNQRSLYIVYCFKIVSMRYRM